LLLGFRVRCSVESPERKLGVEAKANKILDRFRPKNLPPREEALFLWNNLLDAEHWAESCVQLGGKAEIYLVKVLKGKCLVCDFLPIENIFWDLMWGRENHEVEEEARKYWASCKPWKGEEEWNTEVLCWNAKIKMKKLGEAKTISEVKDLIEKIEKTLAR